MRSSTQQATLKPTEHIAKCRHMQQRQRAPHVQEPLGLAGRPRTVCATDTVIFPRRTMLANAWKPCMSAPMVVLLVLSGGGARGLAEARRGLEVAGSMRVAAGGVVGATPDSAFSSPSGVFPNGVEAISPVAGGPAAAEEAPVDDDYVAVTRVDAVSAVPSGPPLPDPLAGVAAPLISLKLSASLSKSVFCDRHDSPGPLPIRAVYLVADTSRFRLSPNGTPPRSWADMTASQTRAESNGANPDQHMHGSTAHDHRVDCQPFIRVRGAAAPVMDHAVHMPVRILRSRQACRHGHRTALPPSHVRLWPPEPSTFRTGLPPQRCFSPSSNPIAAR